MIKLIKKNFKPVVMIFAQFVFLVNIIINELKEMIMNLRKLEIIKILELLFPRGKRR